MTKQLKRQSLSNIFQEKHFFACYLMRDHIKKEPYVMHKKNSVGKTGAFQQNLLAVVLLFTIVCHIFLMTHCYLHEKSKMLQLANINLCSYAKAIFPLLS